MSDLGIAISLIKSKDEQLAALRQRISELEAQRDEFGPLFIRDLCEALGVSDTSTLDVVMQSIRGLKAQAVVTPRQCSRACFERGWQASIEAASGVSDKFSNATRMKLPYPFGGLDDPDDDGFETARPLLNWTGRSISEAIRALQPPAECGDCNPLKPSEHDADMLDEWHKRM